MPPVAVAIGASALIGGTATYFGAKAQGNAIKDSANIQNRGLEKQLAMLKPYNEAGTNALEQLSNYYKGPIEGSALYKWRAKEGAKRLNTQLAARGMYNSGVGMKTLSDFYTRLSGQEENTRLSGLSNIAGMGYNATSAGAQFAGNTSANLSNLAVAGGQNKANMYQNFGDLANKGLGYYGASKGWWDLSGGK